MLIFCLSLFAVGAGATEPQITDRGDAEYYAASGRAAAAARWYRERVTALPKREDYAIAWLDTLGRLPSERNGLLAEIDRWRAAHPALGGAVTARVIGLAAMAPDAISDDAFPDQGGSWCTPALAELAALPEALDARVRVLEARVAAKDVCGEDTTDRLDLHALYLAGAGGALREAWIRNEEGPPPLSEEATRILLNLALFREPWRIGELAFYVRPEHPSAEMRTFVLDRARAMADTRRPSRIAAAIRIFEAAGLYDEERAARTLLWMYDEGNAENLSAMRRPPPRPPSPQETAPAVAAPDPLPPVPPVLGSRRAAERRQRWVARLNAAVAYDDERAQVRARRELWRIDGDVPSALAFVEAAIVADQHSKASRRALEAALEVLRGPPPSEGLAASWRADLAAALDLRARVHVQHDEIDQAIDSYEEAIAVGGPSAMRLHQVALLNRDLRRWDRAIPAYAAAIAHPETLPHNGAILRFSLASILQRYGRTYHGGVDGLVAAHSAPSQSQARSQSQVCSHRQGAATAPARPRPEPAQRQLTDLWMLPVTIDGQHGTLGDLEGLIVVDVWATWCGPCKASMPQFEAFAALHADEATFVRVSVDEDPAVAERFLASRGPSGVLSAHAGADALKQLSIHGIPTYLVLEREEGLIAEIQGWKPELLDEALRQATGR